MIASHPITGVMACDDNGLIGKGRGIPDWGCPEDMQHFCEVTRGHTLIMGCHTYNCFPRSLFKNRTCLVVSHLDHPSRERVTFVKSIEGLIPVIRDVPQTETIYFVGGADLATQLIDRNIIDHFILSHIHGQFEGDCSLPANILKTIQSWPIAQSIDQPGFTIHHYTNPQASDLI